MPNAVTVKTEKILKNRLIFSQSPKNIFSSLHCWWLPSTIKAFLVFHWRLWSRASNEFTSKKEVSLLKRLIRGSLRNKPSPFSKTLLTMKIKLAQRSPQRRQFPSQQMSSSICPRSYCLVVWAVACVPRVPWFNPSSFQMFFLFYSRGIRWWGKTENRLI